MRHQLAFVGEPGHRLGFPWRGVGGDVVDALGRENEIAAVDPAAVAHRLLDEAAHAVAGIHAERAVAAGRLHRSDGRQLAVRAVERDQRADIDIGHAVAVGEAERLFAAHVVGHSAQAPAGHRIVAGVHERDAPRLGLALVHLHRVVGDVEGDIGHVQKVVGEIFLDDVALVAAADHEVVNAVSRVRLHDVPQDRPPADLDHRLGFQVRLFGNPRSEPARENDRLHVSPPWLAGR